MRRRVGMTRSPSLEAGEGIFLLSAPGRSRSVDASIRVDRMKALRLTAWMMRAFAGATVGRARVVGLLLVVRRPGGVTKTVAFVARRQLEQRVDRAGMLIDGRMAIADGRESRRHRCHREISGMALVDLFPGERRGDARVGPRPD